MLLVNEMKLLISLFRFLFVDEVDDEEEEEERETEKEETENYD